MTINQIKVGMLHENCYILGDEETKTCAVIDPGAAPDRILELASELGLKITHILLTHGHFDHIMAAPEIQKQTGATIFIHKDDMHMLSKDYTKHRGYLRIPYEEPAVVQSFADGTEMQIGTLAVKIMHTPGHTAGSSMIFCENAIFSGDTIFFECIGRTDFEDSYPDLMDESLRRISKLQGEYKILPGHEEATTLAHEQEFNPYILRAAHS